MSIRVRIFLGVVLSIGLSFYFLLDWLLDEVRPRCLESVEESLVETSSLLAAVLEQQTGPDGVNTDLLRQALEDIGQHRVQATIYDLVKTDVDLRVYVTDAEGMVIFDSDGGRDEGRDYSRWNDVYLTLRGKYGARTTRVDPEDPASAILYVASPIRVSGVLKGAVTVCKPVQTVTFFIEAAKRKILVAGICIGTVAVLVGLLLAVWLTEPFHALTRYAQAVKDGKRVPAPRVGGHEMKVMARALEEMRDALEGRKYVERYVQQLTHELRSPVAAISGAADLLTEDMPESRRQRFISSIRTEAARLQQTIDRMLQLSAVESRKRLEETAIVDLGAVITDIVDSQSSVALAKQIALVWERPDESVTVQGDGHLLQASVDCLMQNALDFTPPGESVRIELRFDQGFAEVRVENCGPQIPDYALPRVCDRFYSLARPGSGAKSSGLGLSLVQEVATLHHGQASVENTETGVRASLRLPGVREQNSKDRRGD